MFAAIEEGEVVGGAVLFMDEKNSSLMYIGRIFISSAYFRKGYGTQLMKEVEKIHPNVNEWRLDTPIWNIRTNQFYKKLGYIEENRDCEFVYYYKKRLK